MVFIFYFLMLLICPVCGLFVWLSIYICLSVNSSAIVYFVGDFSEACNCVQVPGFKSKWKIMIQYGLCKVSTWIKYSFYLFWYY